MRKYFLSGLLFWIPIAVTIVVIRFIVELLDQSLALLPERYQPDNLLGFHIPGLGLIFTLVIVFLTGLLVANLLGAKLVYLWEKLLARIPLIRSIHSAAKQLIQAIVQPKDESFRKVVMVEFPRKGAWAIGFQTSQKLSNFSNEEALYAIFVPTTPNPTSGFLIMVAADQMKTLDMSVEEAFKMIISIGVVIPDREFCTQIKR